MAGDRASLRGETRTSGPLQVSIRSALSLGIIATVVLTAALVHVPWSLTSRANVADLNARLNGVVIHSIADKVDGLLDNAVAARQAIATNIVDGVIDIDDRAKREFLFLSFLQSQPSLTSIEFAWSDNRAFRARRVPSGQILMEEIVPGTSVGERRTETFRVDANGDLISEGRQTISDTYLVTQQFWFLTAFDKDLPVWTNIYRLPGSGDFGVTTTRTVSRADELIGVLGVSISLDRLSAFLDGIEVSTNGSVFLTNVYDELVAVQRRMASVSDRAEIPRLEDVKLPQVRVVVDALRANDIKLQAFDRNHQFSIRDSARNENYFVTMAPLSQMGLIAAVVIPEQDVLGAINRNTRMLFVALAGFIILIVIAGTLLARHAIGIPLAKITRNLRQLQDFRFDTILEIQSHFLEITQVSAAIVRMNASLSSFQKYIPTELVRTLFERGMEAELGGERRELTILFMDLANFTRLSENLGDGIVEFLATYLSEMSTLIQRGQGTIDKYIGDAIMAFWGAPLPSEEHALEACRTALVCQARLADMRGANPSSLPQIHSRIGINTGAVLVGNIGSHNRLNYTVIGDPVNIASRLESLNKMYGTEIIIGQSTYEQAHDHLVVRSLDRVAVYGKEIGIETYELIAMKDRASSDMLGWVAAYETARVAMRQREWDRAIDLFITVIELRGGCDSVSSMMIDRARTLKATPPDPEWDGLVVMEVK